MSDTRQEDILPDRQIDEKQQVRKWDTSDCLKLPYTCGFGELKEVIC